MFTELRFSKKVLFIFILSCLLLSACAPGADVQGVEENQAAATVTTAPTDTPEPTQTPLPTATATLTPTPKPTATATPNRTATAQAAATAYVEAVLKRIEPDLASYGYTPADGHLIWSNEDPVEITLDKPNMSYYRKLDAPEAGNFILQTSITWNTTQGFAGCGIFFRRDEDEEKGRSNQFQIVRLQYAPLWDIAFYDHNAAQRSLTNGVFSKSILDTNDSTNVVALVVNGRNIVPYINGTKQRLVEDITLKNGLFALSAVQNSGVTTCSFKDTWIWAIDKK